MGLRCEVSEFMAMLRDSFRVVVMLELGPGRYEAASVFKLLSKLLECNSGVTTLSFACVRVSVVTDVEQDWSRLPRSLCSSTKRLS